jgi:tetratricopeptide (TPR) repeat protein
VTQVRPALHQYDSALEIKPHLVAAQYNSRANALKALQQYPAAVEAYKKVLSLKHDHIEAHFNVSALQLYLQVFSEGMAAL